IAAYGSLATLATTLGLNEAAELLKETLAEEKRAESLLTDLANQDINSDAAIEPAMKEESQPTDTNTLATESDPAIDAMKDSISGMDPGAGSSSSGDEATSGGPGSADALLADNEGQLGGRRRGTRKPKQ